MTVLEAGEVVGVAEVGILATVGAVQVTVHGRPHVAVLSTGEPECALSAVAVPGVRWGKRMIFSSATSWELP